MSAAPVRNTKFYIDDRKPFVTFLVEEQLFRVHRYLFELESEVFKSMFEIPQGDNNAEGEADESPIVLPSISVTEMEVLLTFFYFRQGLEEAKFSRTDWRNLLSISHRYECARARERSIKEINKLDPPINDADKIAMAKKFGVEEWLLPACVALVERQDPLSYLEAEKIGLDMTVLLSEAREKYLRRQQNPSYYGYNSYGQRPNMDTTQLVKEVLHI